MTTHVRLIAAFVLLVAVCPVSATTCGPWARTWPPSGSEIALNDRIVFETYGCPRHELLHIAEYKPVLIGAGETVPLVVGSTYATHSLRPFAEATLIPQHRLKPHTSYELHFLNPTPQDPMPLGYCLKTLLLVAADGDGRKWTPRHWNTTAAVDEEPPRWTGMPKILSASSSSGSDYGAEIVVEVPVAESDVLALVELHKAIVTDGPYFFRYLVPISDGKIQLTSEVCHPFWFWIGDTYRLSITAVDYAGNEAQVPGYRVQVPGYIDFRVPEPPEPPLPDIYEASVELSPAVAVEERVTIHYPYAAQHAKFEAVIELTILINADGSVNSTKVTSPRVLLGLEQAASDGISSWVFEPVEGPILREVLAKVRFRISRQPKPPYKPDWNP